ncbi:ABC transporter permease [Caballeronia mineralivorans]|jgi:peptide/nickel transport system permease protein|uniref:ABC transporter permease n=1 Tax=Caballeronia mineralivorans TaxID=2010198 RepID=UPI0023F2E083|nr:ABC transporter permease [Caballeronia mineralivorans]MDB5788377.1 binding-protein-dependent transport system inner rane component [Caballeronia mineralivorans]MEA3097125.1 peptide/nickel transport system permease protein [Caballeronia mineralivorans]
MNLFGKQMPMSAAIGMAIVAVIAMASLCAPLIAPHGETETVGDIWMMPGAGHWLGTDSIGRDMLSRLLYGGRTTLGLALAITLLSFSLGIVTGFAAAVLGRKVDHVLSRIVDTLMAMPVLIFALMILSVLGTSMPVLIGTIAILDSTRVFRLARLVAQGIAVQEYVEAARLRGEGLAWIIRREILPNAVPPLLAEFGMRFGFTILFVAGLSFLGLGIQPPYADWGGMVRDNAQVINFGGIAPLVPAAAIALLTVGINLIVDWLLSVRAVGQAGAIA